MPEPAKTRQSRQHALPGEADAGAPEAVAEDAVAEPGPIVADEAAQSEAVVAPEDAASAEAAADETDEPGEDDEDPAADGEDEPDEDEPDEDDEPEPVKAPSKREVERRLKAAEKRRNLAEKERRLAEFKAARVRQEEADRVQLWADRRQADADRARAKVEKAAAKAAAVREAAGENPTGLTARRLATAERWERHTREDLDRIKADADALRKRARKSGVHAAPSGKVTNPGSRQWVPPTFITVGMLGVIWLVVYYITASTGIYVPVMSDIGGWNVVIGMGLMASSFGIATLWK